MTVTDKDINISQMAEKALAEADGDYRRASDILYSWAEENTAVRNAILHPLLSQACWNAIQRLQLRARDQYFKKTHKPKASRPETEPNKTRGLIAASAHNWYEYPLRDNLKLGDATKTELLEIADYHFNLSRTHKQRGHFFKMLADELNVGEVLKTTLDISAIERISDKSKAMM